jgi:hypothetical protein
MLLQLNEHYLDNEIYDLFILALLSRRAAPALTPCPVATPPVCNTTTQQ